MRHSLFSILFLLSFVLLSCAPEPRAGASGALFFYLRMGDSPTLVLLPDPDSRQPFGEIALALPPGCSFWSLTPAPAGPWLALEWQCPHGPVTQLVNARSAAVSFLVDDPTIDTRFLAWSADGKSAYLKIAALSDPQIVRVDVAPRRVTVLPLSPNTYNLTVSPSDGMILSALTNGIGAGSELWAAEAQSGLGRKILADPLNIIGLMRFSPDGARVAAIRLPDGYAEFPPGELWLADSDGSHPHLAATADAGRGMFPVWSPNGEKIAFIGRTHPDDPASINLSILTLSDLNRSILRHGYASQDSAFNLQLLAPPAWSPDGSRLYFTLAPGGKMEVWFHEIATGNTQKLFEDACCAGWID